MALRTTYSAESWDKIYQAFSAVSFVSYDFDTIKQSLIDYTRAYYPEYYNDYIQSSEFIALLELFAYIAEQLAYRIDMVGHENFITTAQRKQSILRLAKLISYKATRNIAVRGLVKFTSISTTERVIDSRGTNLSGLTIIWNDVNNANWKEQFFLVMNRVLNSRFGNPQKTFQISDVVMDLYSLKNQITTFPLGVFAFNVNTGIDSFNMEVVPADIDPNGPFEREPDPTSALSIIYANDGVGDGSDYTGFLAYVKQGVLTRIDYDVADSLPNRQIDFEPTGVNDTDVWVQRIDDNGAITERWSQADTVADENLVFNSNRDTRNKYEVDTLEQDRVRIIFGDGDFSNIPQGVFRFWIRQSIGRSIVIQKNKVSNQPFSFTYAGSTGNLETCALTFSLTTTLQNGSATETIEHIRRSAPATYYAQNRMVNGQDYNTFMLKDPTILRLKAINRTFAGQPKYIEWNDASGKYENIKLFGDDLQMRYMLTLNTQTTNVSGQSLIDSVIEPLLNTSGVINTMLHISASDPAMNGVVSSPRRKFIEDNRGGIYRDKNGNYVSLYAGGAGDGSLKEKTAIQALIDRHYYGEPLEYVLDASSNVLARIPDPDLFPKDDSKIYADKTPRTVDGVNRYPPGDTGSGLQAQAEQKYFALRYNRYMKGIGNGVITSYTVPNGFLLVGEVLTIEVKADGSTVEVRSNKRGSFASGIVNQLYRFQPSGQSTSAPLFFITPGSIAFEQGDAFILQAGVSGTTTTRTFGFGGTVVNLNGWWECLRASPNDLPAYVAGMANPNLFTTADSPLALKQHSWVIFIRRITQASGTRSITVGYEVHTRDLKLTVKSPTTKFWYNSVEQLIDNQTKKRVFDNIKILRSNEDSAGTIIGKSEVYDVVGAIKDSNGIINFNMLEVAPTDLLNENASGDLIPDHLLQYETFAKNSYEYFFITNPTVLVTPTSVVNSPDGTSLVTFSDGSTATFAPGAFSDNNTSNSQQAIYGRSLRMPKVDGEEVGLDFMWQHFSPFTNIIDPSVTNIHDVYLMTRGYYDNVISYIRGVSTTIPAPPTPLDLRNSYGKLLNSKMLSDTVVLHPGKIRLLFGDLAEPQLRAKFKVVKQGSASLTNERIKEEVLNVINTFFDIDGWDFGDTFYATELITLIHQRLPTDVASVVLVPVYSTNSFGSLFTVASGHDEILQSAAQLQDVEIVEALTPKIIKQS